MINTSMKTQPICEKWHSETVSDRFCLNLA